MYIGTLQKCNVNANLNGQNLVVMVRSKVTAVPIWAELLSVDIQSSGGGHRDQDSGSGQVKAELTQTPGTRILVWGRTRTPCFLYSIMYCIVFYSK